MPSFPIIKRGKHWFCPECGHQMDHKEEFCPKCEHVFDGEVQEPEHDAQHPATEAEYAVVEQIKEIRQRQTVWISAIVVALVAVFALLLYVIFFR